MKICSNCKELKTLDCFSKDKAKKDGFVHKCKKCCSKYYFANKEKVREARIQYRLDNVDRTKERYLANIDRIKENKKEYYLANIDKIKKYRKENAHIRRQWNLANAEKIKEQQRQYNLANPEIRKNADNRRRTKKLSNGVYEISKKELKRIYSSPCFYCGSTNSIHADHIIPISKGGRHSIGNLLPACAKCNMSKGSRLLVEWRGRKSNLK
jgi:hypothetical protein